VMTDEQKNFIEMIGNAAVSYYKTYGILPSLTISQAILESNWGKSGLSRDCHNYFGMKWKTGCGCDYKEYQTKEQNKEGSYVTIKARFRKYDSVEEGIKGYYEFLQYKRYQNLKGVVDVAVACELIRKDGWATSLKPEFPFSIWRGHLVLPRIQKASSCRMLQKPYGSEKYMIWQLTDTRRLLSSDS
jgi:flagellum-specific peptidoglycan hydrolase FlgJ